MDTSKIGIATAKAMERVEALVESGDIPSEAEVAVACIVVALDYPTPDQEDRHLISDVTSDIFVFCEPSEIYIQMGVLELATEARNE